MMNSIIIKVLLRLAIYIFISYLLLSAYFFYVYVHPKRFVSGFTPKELGLKYEDIVLITNDNIKLSGWFIPQKNSNKAVIVCHGYPADKGNVLDMAEFLSPYYNLLFFDFRAMGNSQGKFTSGGWKEREDFLAAVSFMKKKGFEDIGAIGFSMGAAAILMSDSPDIKAIVSDSSYSNLDSVLSLIFQDFGPLRKAFAWSMKFLANLFLQMDVNKVVPLKYIPQIKAPVFLIHCNEDTQIPLEHAQLLHNANPQNQLWIISGLDHTEGLSGVKEEYQRRVLEFLKDNL
ncbi:MAG: alpha/beta fold hydrolase [Candidatus Omnitrophota bacterium]